jgi:sulfoxide reductase heme-binding subunit YedZ
MKKLKFTPLQIAVHIGAWIPLIWLIWAYNAHRLTVNPIQDATQRTGIYAMLLLVLSLSCTPINTVLGWKEAIKVRRPLGLYAFMYAAIHVLIFSGLGYSFNLAFLYYDLRGKIYIWAGLAAVLILLALAATSYRWAMKRMGKNWKRLHRLVYAAGVLTILHYAWSKKGDLFHLRGDIRGPLTYGLVVLLLLTLRMPLIARGIKRLRAHLSYWFSRFSRYEGRTSLEQGRR